MPSFSPFLATAAFNFFFLPPLDTFTIADPQNWVALIAFLVTALVASKLSERAGREAEQAKQRRHEVERLYALSQQLLTTDNVLQLLNAVPSTWWSVRRVRGGVCVPDKGNMYRSGIEVPSRSGPAQVHRRARRALSDCARDVSYMPLQMGVRTVGASAWREIFPAKRWRPSAA